MNQNMYYEKMKVNKSQIEHLTKKVARLTSQLVALEDHIKAEEKPKQEMIDQQVEIDLLIQMLAKLSSKLYSTN